MHLPRPLDNCEQISKTSLGEFNFEPCVAKFSDHGSLAVNNGQKPAIHSAAGGVEYLA